MFIPFDIIILLILSPFILVLWGVLLIVKLGIRLTIYLVKFMMGWLISLVRWLLGKISLMLQ